MTDRYHENGQKVNNKRRLVNTEEAAKILGVTPRAIQKKFSKGKIKGEFVNSHKGYGKSGQVLKVWIDNSSEPGVRSSELKANPKNRYKIKRGEPGCRMITPIENGAPLLNDVNSLSSVGHSQDRSLGDGDHNKAGGEGVAVFETLPSGLDNLASPNQTPPSPGGGGISSLPVTLPVTLDSGLRRNDKMDRIANLRFALIQAFNEQIAQNHRPKKEIIRNFLSLYNRGLLLPDIHKELGEISRATLYNWRSAVRQAHGPRDLTPQYGGAGQSKVTEHEKNIVLTLLLHQNRLKIAYGITLAKEYLARKRMDSPSSSSTLRRFVEQFKREHYDLWILRREGEKALNDKVLPYAERDWRVLNVGEGLVADGHRLNFLVINPNTGKPCRPMLVMFWDWKSSYPLGFEIMIEENIQCVTSALRNAILALGKIPKWVYLDNGKAFKAKIFTQDIDFEDSELPGMFARLNINYHFAKPYNAQSKPIERIFGILNDQLERLIPSYTGASINDKPAWTKRNEKYAQSLHNPYIPTIPETKDLILSWRDRYAERSSRGRDGLRPIDILRQAQDDPSQGFGKVEPAELIYLMMDREIKHVHRNGVTWRGWNWFNEEMYGLKDKVLIRYSDFDLSQIYVFHKEFANGFVIAKPIELVHPMASESENPKDMEAVKDVNRLQKKVKNTTRKLCDLLETKQASQIDWSRSRTPEISETIQKIEDAKKPRVVNISPFPDGATVEEPRREKFKAPKDWSGFYEHWERYDHHLRQDPSTLTKQDLDFITFYKTTSEYQSIYGIKSVSHRG